MPVELNQRYGRLTTIARAGLLDHRRSYWICACECGSLFVKVRADYLADGTTRSCGCLRARRAGQSRSRTYVTWAAMRRRCSDPRHPRWDDYGGRGIRVCVQWDDPVTGFAAFLRDVGERPIGRTLDRIDSNGMYEPSNVKWATIIEQRWNRRDMVGRDRDRETAAENAHWDEMEREAAAQAVDY